MQLSFEPTNSFCYNFARYVALPEIQQRPEVITGDDFRLIDVARDVIDAHLTPEQQTQTFERPQAGGQVSIGKTIRFYIPFIAKRTGMLTNLGGGIFRLPLVDDLSADDLEEAALESEEMDVDESGGIDLSGTLYAFTFPLLIKERGPYPIKVGLASGDADKRVMTQCRQAASFEQPRILRTWPTSRVRALELAVHNVLRVRGRWREDAPGKEWFDTTIDEVDEIIRFIGRA
jgi:hypothetical protein